MRSLLVVAVLFVSLAIACSDSSTSSSGANDAGTTSSSSSSGSTPVDSGTDTAPPSHECTTFVDRTADDATRNLQWDLDVLTRPERCMKIKVNQSVKFSTDGQFTPADLVTHPIEAAGGDTPNPFAETPVDAAGNIAFDKAGTYKFRCTSHPTEMLGAIQVVP
jgi:hypothetical protein